MSGATSRRTRRTRQPHAPPPAPLRHATQIFKEAQELLPGGVNSPVRAFKSVGGQPIVFDRVKGAYCWDADNNKYIDYGAPALWFCSSWPCWHGLLHVLCFRVG